MERHRTLSGSIEREIIMEIRCKATKRFLMKIDIETYYNDIKKMGIDITTPLIIEIPCPKCHMIEVYAIYPTTYVLLRAYKYGGLQEK